MWPWPNVQGVRAKLHSLFQKKDRSDAGPGNSWWCAWPWTTLVVLCDGTVVCGCADPRAERPVGNLNHQSLEEIWLSRIMTHIRQGLIAGDAPFCQSCGLKQIRSASREVGTPPVLPAGPTRLFIEPTIHCNISCFNSHCNKESGIVATRKSGLLSEKLFHSIIDQAAATLQRLELFNYGEPFINKKLPSMIKYVRQTYPHIYTFTSTNGLVWRNEQDIRTVIHSGLHELVFSVDGASAEIYNRYRRGGDFNRVITNMRTMIKIKQAEKRQYPLITLRSILFQWNDSDLEMDRIRALAHDLDVDRLCWELTDHPSGCPSKRFLPGTSDYERIKYEIWDSGANANALSEKALRAELLPDTTAITTTAGATVAFSVTVRNCGRDLWFATSPDNLRFVTLGLQLLDRNYNCLERDFLRVLLPNNTHPQQTWELPVTISAPPKGEYCLKCDMVLEGYGWFESGGSAVKYITLSVR